MSDLNEKDIAEYQENKEKTEYLEDNPLIKTTVGHDLWEWSKLITELSEKELKYVSCKEKYEVDSKILEETTDFKALYGKNNESIRKHHIKQELYDDYETIKLLELGIADLKRRISYLKSLIRVKAVIMEVKE